ncbi:MAG TPA: WYL domain-containing protein, partial [Bacillota bacterium]|nr:WYL domain-containing protein [Bacillota bacterium]
MAGNERSKLKLLYLVRFFEEKTDEDNGVSMGEILKYLGENGISAERKSIYRDLECLREFGYDIEKRGKPARYYLTTRDFDFDELEYLFKSVESARFISKEKTEK